MKLDRIEQAHAALGGKQRGRRYTTLQVNHAYAVLLASEFQGYCRDIHSESIDYIVSHLTELPYQQLLRTALQRDLTLDKGNPNPGNLGKDFGRLVLGVPFWQRVGGLDKRNDRRQKLLQELLEYRNAIAHQDWRQVPERLLLSTVQRWRRACSKLASSFDVVLSEQIRVLTGTRPW